MFIYFERVLEVVDDALCSVAEAQKKTSKDVESVDEKFRKAIHELKVYEEKHHSNSKVVEGRMEDAQKKDKVSSTTLNRLKEKFRVREELAPLLCRNTNVYSQPMKEEPTNTVEFHIHKSLPDKRPTIVKRERMSTDLSMSLMESDPYTRSAQ
jgi:hypothetical protein